MVELTLPVVIVAGLIDAINPCAIGVLILLLTYFAFLRDSHKIIVTSLIYIAFVYITYLLLGIGTLSFLATTGLYVQFYYLVASIAVFAGVLEVKDFIWYGRWLSLSIPHRAINLLEKMARRATVPAAALLGFLVALFEFPCTGAPYLAILALLSTTPSALAYSYLIFYNLIFVSPLIVISVLVYWGYKAHLIEKWRRKTRGWMRLATGIFLIAIGIWIMSTVA